MLLSSARITYKRWSDFQTVYRAFNFDQLNYFQIMLYYTFSLGCWLLLAIVPIRSSVLSLIPNPSEDPFFDVYIETVRQMNTKEILSLPKLNDTEFIDYLLNGDDNQFIPSIRVDNSIFDSIRDDLLIHQTDIDQEWETLMVSGPLAVNYMGNLMVLASKKDFPFQVQPDYVFRYIRYPQSFRATLTQVSNDMYTALMDAHTAMNRIQLSIQQVPTHVKTALKLITSASDNMMKTMLPRTLESVSRLASDSAAYANATLTRFNLLQELLAEIIELSATTQSTHDASIEKMKEQQLNSTLEQEMLSEKLGLIKQQYAESKAALEKARENYYKAMQEASQVTAPQLIQSGASGPSVIESAIIMLFDPVAGIKCLLSNCKTPTYTLDNTKFENAFRLAQVAKQELERAEQIHNEHFQQQLAEQNELAKTMSQMALLDLAQMSTEEIIQVLLEATNQIHEIREQWARLIQFFSRLAAQASSTQNIVVKDFVEVVQQAQSDQLLIDPIDREFFLEILMPTVTTIESDAHLLFTMAKTYYAVSSEHMITQIAGIGKFMLLQTDDERTNHLRATSNATMATSYKITQFAQSRHDQYLFLSHQRQEEYKKYIETLALQQLQEVVG